MQAALKGLGTRPVSGDAKVKSTRDDSTGTSIEIFSNIEIDS